MSKEDLYSGKSRSYFTIVRQDVVDFVTVGPNLVIEVGCGAGSTMARLKQAGKANLVVGIELDRKTAESRDDSVDAILVGDVEIMTVPFPEKTFDYVIFGDVLEHLVSPLRTLEKFRRYMKDDGHMIVSIPNIRHFQVLVPLMFFGDFDYTKEGILDEGHLRFFTKKTIVTLLKKANLSIIDIRADCRPFDSLNRLTLRVFEPFLSVRYIVNAGKSQASAADAEE